MRKIKTRELVLIAFMIAITVCANIITAFTIPLYAGTAFVIISGAALGPVAGVVIGVIARLISNMCLGQGIWTIWQIISWALLGGLAGISFSRVDVSIYGKEKNKEKHLLKENEILRSVVILIISFLMAYISYIVFADKNESFFGWRIYLFGAIGIIINFLLQKERFKIQDFTLAIYTFVTVFIIYGGVINMGAMVMSTAIPSSESGVNTDTLKLLYITGLPFDFMHATGAAITIFVIGKKIIKRIERIKIKYGFYTI